MRNSSVKKETMKRLSIIAFVMVVLAAWVVPGYSVDVNWDAQYRVRAITTSNGSDFNDDKSADTDGWIDQRFRLGIKLTEAPVSGYVQLQIGGDGPNDSHTWGTTTTSVVFRQAYLTFPLGPVGFTAGRTYASHGFLAGGIFENIRDRYVISYKASDELSGSFIHAKGREGSAPLANSGSADPDLNIYNLGATWKPKGAPYDLGARIYYVRDGGLAFPATGSGVQPTGTWDAWWLTAQSNIKAGPANIYVSAAFLTGSSEDTVASTPDLDLSGWAAHIDANIAPGPFKVGVVAGIGSGDDNATDDKLETFFAPSGASYIQSHIFFQNGENTYAPTILTGTGLLNTQNGKLETLSNVTWAGLYGDYKVNPDLTLGAKIATFMQTETIGTQDDKIGNEVDLTANYMIYKNLSLLAFAAWFMPDDGITGGGTATDDTVTEYYARLQWEW